MIQQERQFGYYGRDEEYLSTLFQMIQKYAGAKLFIFPEKISLKFAVLDSDDDSRSAPS